MEIRRFTFSYDEGWSLRRTPEDGANYGEQGLQLATLTVGSQQRASTFVQRIKYISGGTEKKRIVLTKNNIKKKDTAAKAAKDNI